MHEVAESTEVLLLTRISLAWMTVVGAAAIAVGVGTGGVALAGFGIYTVRAGVAWVAAIAEARRVRLPAAGARARGTAATHDLLIGSHPDASWPGIALVLATLIAIVVFSGAKRQVGLRPDSPAPALAALIGLVGNAAFGAWWLDPVVGLRDRGRGAGGGPHALGRATTAAASRRG